MGKVGSRRSVGGIELPVASTLLGPESPRGKKTEASEVSEAFEVNDVFEAPIVEPKLDTGRRSELGALLKNAKHELDGVKIPRIPKNAKPAVFRQLRNERDEAKAEQLEMRQAFGERAVLAALASPTNQLVLTQFDPDGVDALGGALKEAIREAHGRLPRDTADAIQAALENYRDQLTGESVPNSLSLDLYAYDRHHFFSGTADSVGRALAGEFLREPGNLALLREKGAKKTLKLFRDILRQHPGAAGFSPWINENDLDTRQDTMKGALSVFKQSARVTHRVPLRTYTAPAEVNHPAQIGHKDVTKRKPVTRAVTAATKYLPTEAEERMGHPLELPEGASWGELMSEVAHHASPEGISLRAALEPSDFEEWVRQEDSEDYQDYVLGMMAQHAYLKVGLAALQEAVGKGELAKSLPEESRDALEVELARATEAMELLASPSSGVPSPEDWWRWEHMRHPPSNKETQAHFRATSRQVQLAAGALYEAACLLGGEYPAI